ncbi:hypothetical protein HCA69_15445 [Listeria grandensis]|uniref:Uncharacterized protein n=1 Tax=Listeria grandensis TaxID=1494963 RepID=A0A7X1CR63_9LIST|nr:hypothetical protein [Listeria grandensis]MBC1937763.1 hypothetical protein [Listeria grandensis]
MEKQMISDAQEFEICNRNMEYQREAMLSLIPACCSSKVDSNREETMAPTARENHIVFLKGGVYFW